MYVRKATKDDFSEIVYIYAGARTLMRETGNGTQWKNTYPSDDIIRADIENGNLHVLFDEDGIEGVFALFPEGDPVYDRIDGAWLNDKPHAAVHRVASAGKKKGILSECMRYCFSTFDNIKIDTHENNKIMQHQLEKAGFSLCGIITLTNDETRIAYQCYRPKSKEKQGSLRAMFYNVFGYHWFPDREKTPHLYSGPIPLRQRIQADMIASYAPDLLGLQEYSAHYHKGMTPLLKAIGYREAESADSRNYTALFYRPETLTLVESGFVMYPETMAADDGTLLNVNDAASKSLTWAVFEEIASKKRFIALSTHFMYDAAWLTEKQQNESRIQNAKILLQTLQTIRKQDEYCGLPVLMGGDLNCAYGSDPIKTLENGGMQWLPNIAPVTDGSCGLKPYAVYDKTKEEYIAVPLTPDGAENSIDHVFYLPAENGKTALSFANYLTVSDRSALLTSDHCPRFSGLAVS